MAVYYIALPLSEVDDFLSYLEQQDLPEMSKLLLEIIGNSLHKPLLSEETCQKIYQLYIKLDQVQPHADVQINIEFLKGKKALLPGTFKTLNIETLMSHVNPKLYDGAASSTQKIIKMHKNVVLGGTFDRLHIGHKILLTEAAARCEEKITVGVTDESMIKSKKLWELIEPVDMRISKVLDFLQNVDSHLKYEVVPISDMFGPTQTDPNLDLLVVSAETLKGGHKVNEVRVAKGYSPLTLHAVELVEAPEGQEGDEHKVSSSNGRLRLLGTRLKSPKPNLSLPNWPYIIGLTGVIASGKSSVGSVMVEKGAGVIDCDKVAHSLYKKGSPTFNAVVHTFGPGVVADDGEIDRRALGAIVFNSKDELTKLNNLLWPAILNASLDEAVRMHKEENKDVIVLEAAVLLQAGWHKKVHEVWTCVIPTSEAITRVMERNNLNEDAAKARVDAQPSSKELVNISTVVFSTLYSHDFTKAQVNRAWAGLHNHFKDFRIPNTKL